MEQLRYLDFRHAKIKQASNIRATRALVMNQKYCMKPQSYGMAIADVRKDTAIECRILTYHKVAW